MEINENTDVGYKLKVKRQVWSKDWNCTLQCKHSLGVLGLYYIAEKKDVHGAVTIAE